MTEQVCWWCDKPLNEDEIEEDDYVCDSCYVRQRKERANGR